jgi:hypothetical protein
VPIETTFIFDGVNSTTMGLYNIRLETGLAYTPLWGNRQIIEEKIPKKDNPYFYNVEKSPIEFTLTFSLLDEKFTEAKKIDLIRWLIHDDYREFQTTDYLGKYFYCIVVDASDLYLNAENKGYFQIKMRTNAWHAWSPIYEQNFDLSSNLTTTTIALTNQSNILTYYYPEIEVELVGDSTGFSLKNNTNSGKTLTFSGLSALETVYINNEKKQIISDTDLYRYDKFNSVWLELLYGQNQIVVTGKCRIWVRSQFPLIV